MKLQNLGLARFSQGRFGEALALFQEGAQLRPEFLGQPVPAGGLSGPTWPGQAAREALARARSLNPTIEVRTHADQTFHDAAQRQLFLDGIALADEERPTGRSTAP